jgi:hypothetical protein
MAGKKKQIPDALPSDTGINFNHQLIPHTPFPCRRESMKNFWMPVFTGMTFLGDTPLLLPTVDIVDFTGRGLLRCPRKLHRKGKTAKAMA